MVAPLERRATAGKPVDTIASVASLFVSRVDAKDDGQLPERSPLRGRVAVANAKLAYQLYQQRFSDERWTKLAAAGANRQRPLWASTGTKDPAYSDVLYVEELVGPDVVSTMPDKTLRAFADHGRVRRTVDADVDEARRVLDELPVTGVDLDAITSALEREGVTSFCDSYNDLLDCIADKATSLGMPVSQLARPGLSDRDTPRGQRLPLVARHAATFICEAPPACLQPRSLQLASALM